MRCTIYRFSLREIFGSVFRPFPASNIERNAYNFVDFFFFFCLRCVLTEKKKISWHILQHAAEAIAWQHFFSTHQQFSRGFVTCINLLSAELVCTGNARE
jgi:hypothetical protein